MMLKEESSARWMTGTAAARPARVAVSKLLVYILNGLFEDEGPRAG